MLAPSVQFHAWSSVSRLKCKDTIIPFKMYCLIHTQNMQYHYILICLSVSCFHSQELKNNVTQEFSKISLKGYTSVYHYTHYSCCITPLQIFESLFQFLYRMSKWKEKKNIRMTNFNFVAYLTVSAPQLKCKSRQDSEFTTKIRNNSKKYTTWRHENFFWGMQPVFSPSPPFQ